MEQQNRANPAVYVKLREHALTMPLPVKSDRIVLVLVMDWYLSNGLASVVAAFDGSASIYLSSGGGFIGGGQGSAEIRAAAMHAVKVAEQSIARFEAVTSADLPERGTVYFYARTTPNEAPAAGATPAPTLMRAVASEKTLSDGSDPLTALGGAMQNVITRYRLFQAQKAQAPKTT